MIKVKKVRNNLSAIIQGKVTQKELAKEVGTTEASLSDFSNMKRSTINVELLVNILTYINENIIKDMQITPNDMFSIVDTFVLEKYKEKEIHLTPTMQNIYFRYSTDPNDVFIEAFDIVPNGRIIQSKLVLNSYTFRFENICKIYNSIVDVGMMPMDDYYICNFREDCDYSEEGFIHRFTSVALYKGEIVKITKMKNEEEATEFINKL